MPNEFEQPQTSQSAAEAEKNDGDLNDLLQELRILLQGAQMLTAFLIVVPFNQGFERIDPFEKWIYLATFLGATSSLIFFSAPAARHRLERPLLNRELFKKKATRSILIGQVLLSVALTLVTNLVITEVLGFAPGVVAAVIIGGLIGLNWWLLPLLNKRKAR